MDDFNIIEILINLFITATSYLVFPFIFSRINKGKKTYSKKTIALIAIANALVVKIIISVLTYPNIGSFGPTYLWGWVGYEMLKGKLLEAPQNVAASIPQSVHQQPAQEPAASVISDEKVKVKVKLKSTKQEHAADTLEQPVKIETNKESNKIKLPPALLYIITAVSLCLSIFLFISNNELKTQLNKANYSLENLRESSSELIKTNQSLEHDLNKLQENYDDYEMAYYFAVKHVKLYINGEYHSIGCDKIRKHGATSYKIYNDASSVDSSSCFCEGFANWDQELLNSKYQYIIP